MTLCVCLDHLGPMRWCPSESLQEHFEGMYCLYDVQTRYNQYSGKSPANGVKKNIGDNECSNSKNQQQAGSNSKNQQQAVRYHFNASKPFFVPF